jgi:alkylhydroperoxidase family enzyme
MPFLFSYGTLQQEAVQLSTFGRRLDGYPDELVAFERATLTIQDPEFVARSGTADHAIVRYTGRDDDRVAGMVLELSDAELAAADGYEPAGYTRVPARLASGKRAWVYADATAPRVPPVAPPYAPELQAVFDRIMPPGVPPLHLFTTLARVPRTYERFRAGSLLDRGPVSLRHREIAIDRTCARCGCAYEWGVHVAFFGERVALTPEQVRATVHGDASDPAWTEDERLLIRMVDELHDTARLSDELWHALAAAFSLEQIFELIALVGFYHTVSFFANGLRLPAETYARPFPPA